MAPNGKYWCSSRKISAEKSYSPPSFVLSTTASMVFFWISVAVGVTGIRGGVQCIGEELAEREIEFSKDIARIVMTVCGGAIFIGDTIAVCLYKKLNRAFKTNDGKHSDRYEKSVVANAIDKRCSESFDHVIGNGIDTTTSIAKRTVALDNFRIWAHRLSHLDHGNGKS